MSQEVFKFSAHEPLSKILHALETPKGLAVGLEFKDSFSSVSDLLAHTTHSAKGTVVHLDNGNTVLFEHVPLHEFSTVATDIGTTFGF